MLQYPVVPVVALALYLILLSAWLKLKSVMLELLRVVTAKVLVPMVTLNVCSSKYCSKVMVSP